MMAKPKDGTAALAIIQGAAQQASKHNGIKLQETAGDRFFNEPTHKRAAAIINAPQKRGRGRPATRLTEALGGAK